MKPPNWRFNPMFMRLLYGPIVLAIVVHLIASYLQGTWKPSAGDIAAGLVGAALVEACFLTFELSRYRRAPDAYCRELLAGIPAWYHLEGAIVGGLSGAVGGTFGFGHVSLCYLSAALAAVLSNGGHYTAVWKRMWELYEQDQSAAPSVAQPVPPAPEAR